MLDAIVNEKRILRRQGSLVILLVVVPFLAGCNKLIEENTAPEVVHRDAELVFQSECADCHDGESLNRAPRLQAIQNLSPARVYFSLSNGVMKSQGKNLTEQEKLELAEFISQNAQPYVAAARSYCENSAVNPTAIVNSWGFNSSNSRQLGPDTSQISSANVSSLSLQWVFGLPQLADARSQPVISDDTLFIAATSGYLFAIDRFSGCLKWQLNTPSAPRTALTLGFTDYQGESRAALFYGDGSAMVNAVDAVSGELIWQADVQLYPESMITGAITQQDDQLIVPLSSIEVALAANPDHECCRSHGAVISINSSTGALNWISHMTEDASPQGESPVGTLQWGPSGAPVWSTPGIDSTRNAIYVGTGQNTSRPATKYSDAVVALDLNNGDVLWHFQATAGDVYNQACDFSPNGPNCPTFPGPDFDIGASVIITADSSGRDLLLAGQKSGDIYALDPDRQGELIWRNRAGGGSALGGIHWGMALHDDKVIATVADPEIPRGGYIPEPGVYAFDIDDGELIWTHQAEASCNIPLYQYLTRTTLYPECSLFYGFSAPPTVVNDLIFAGALDGRLSALDVNTGEPLWSIETLKEYDTVNDVPGHGGSIDVAGVLSVGKMVYVQSGYSLFGQLPGNVLLAFEIENAIE